MTIDDNLADSGLSELNCEIAVPIYPSLLLSLYSDFLLYLFIRPPVGTFGSPSVFILKLGGTFDSPSVFILKLGGTFDSPSVFILKLGGTFGSPSVFILKSGGTFGFYLFPFIFHLSSPSPLRLRASAVFFFDF